MTVNWLHTFIDTESNKPRAIYVDTKTAALSARGIVTVPRLFLTPPEKSISWDLRVAVSKNEPALLMGQDALLEPEPKEGLSIQILPVDERRQVRIPEALIQSANLTPKAKIAFSGRGNCFAMLDAETDQRLTDAYWASKENGKAQFRISEAEDFLSRSL